MRAGSEACSTDTENGLSRQAVHRPRREVSLTQVGGVPEEQTYYKRTPKGPASAGLVELGRRSSEKNHSVGRRAGKRIFRRAFPRLTESDYMGGELLRITRKPLFSDMA